MIAQRADRKGYAIETALLFDAVVAIDSEQRGLGELRFLCLDDIADIDQLVGPGIQRDDLARGILEYVRDDAALDRRDDLLPHRGIGRDAVVDRVAARLLVVLDELLEGDILLLGEALDPPNLSRLGGRISDVRTGQT